MASPDRAATVTDVLAEVAGEGSFQGYALWNASTDTLLGALRSVSGHGLGTLLYAVGKRLDPRATSAVVPMLTNDSATVRREAAEALRRIGDSGANPALRSAILREADTDVLLALYAAAAESRCDACLPDLLALAFGSGTEAVRIAAGEAACALAPRELVAAAANFSSNPLPRELVAAAERAAAVRDLGTRDSDFLRQVGRTGVWEVHHENGLVTELFEDGTVLGLDHRHRFEYASDEPESPIWSYDRLTPGRVVASLEVRRWSMLPTIRRILGRLDEPSLVRQFLHHALEQNAEQAIELIIRQLLQHAGEQDAWFGPPTVARLLEHEGAAIREAMLQWVFFDDSEPRTSELILRRWQQEGVPGVRHRLVSRLGRLGEIAREPLTRSLAAADPVERRAAAWGLRRIGPVGSSAELAAALNRETWKPARAEMDVTLRAWE